MLKPHLMRCLPIFTPAISACSSATIQSSGVITSTAFPDEYEISPTAIASKLRGFTGTLSWIP